MNCGGDGLGSSGGFTCVLPQRSGTARISGTAGSGIKVLDLFAGAGGLSSGVQQASERFEVVPPVQSNIGVAVHLRWEFRSWYDLCATPGTLAPRRMPPFVLVPCTTGLSQWFLTAPSTMMSIPGACKVMDDDS